MSHYSKSRYQTGSSPHPLNPPPPVAILRHELISRIPHPVPVRQAPSPALIMAGGGTPSRSGQGGRGTPSQTLERGRGWVPLWTKRGPHPPAFLPDREIPYPS